MTDKQKLAIWRNWSIRRLRALYGLCAQLDSDLQEQAEVLIDCQLDRMGAEPETCRRDKKLEKDVKEWAEYLKRKSAGDLA